MSRSFVVLAVATLFAASCTSTPEPISQERAKTPRGQVTVVEFLDFECPFCRNVNAELAPAVAAHRAEIRLVRRHVPLVSLHPHALPAARASLCADQLGKGDALADALFRAPLDELSDEGCTAIGAKIGLDPASLRACMLDDRTDERIREDTRAFRASGGSGVPLVWIDDHRFEGEQSPGTFQRAIDDAVQSAR
jgi:protein-disulfide isomerase